MSSRVDCEPVRARCIGRIPTEDWVTWWVMSSFATGNMPSRPSWRLRIDGIRHRRAAVRFTGFAAVGLGVFLTGSALLYGLVSWAHMEAHLAYFLTAIYSIEVNFALNKLVNWRDRPGGIVRQLVSFHATKVVTIIANQVLFAVLLAKGINYMADMVILTALITVVNYLANDRLVFRRQVSGQGIGDLGQRGGQAGRCDGMERAGPGLAPDA